MAVDWVIVGIVAGLVAVLLLVFLFMMFGHPLLINESGRNTTYVTNSNILDLHGYGQWRARSEIDEFLRRKKTEYYRGGNRYVHIITGKGIHSRGDPVLKPMVEEYLREKNYSYEWDYSGGSVKVDLRSV